MSRDYPMDEVRLLPACTGIYAFVASNGMRYVGQALNIRSRACARRQLS
jgi:excinuclease UvrABC nuclease subunit